jgi:hypothetical protein
MSSRTATVQPAKPLHQAQTRSKTGMATNAMKLFGVDG